MLLTFTNSEDQPLPILLFLLSFLLTQHSLDRLGGEADTEREGLLLPATRVSDQDCSNSHPSVWLFSQGRLRQDPRLTGDMPV